MSTSFVQATRSKLRFILPSLSSPATVVVGRGAGGNQYSTEDLWDLKLSDLNRMAVAIHNSLAGQTVSFIEETDHKETKETKANQLRLTVLKEVITIKQNDAKEAKAAAEAQNNVNFLEELLNKAELKQMEELSIDEIKKRIAQAKGETPAAAPATTVAA